MPTQNFLKKISVQDFLILERCIGNSDNPVYRSSPPEVFCKKVFLEISQEAYNFIKKETRTQVFSCEFCEVSKKTFSYRTPPVAASMSNTHMETFCENS